MLETGIKGLCETVVKSDMTAKAMKSGSLDVFATPAMIALMEETACKSIDKELSEDLSSVGVYLDIKHVAPSPVGMKISCESLLEKIEGKKLVFSVKVYDAKGLVGEGEHHRVIIDRKRFMDGANARLDGGL